MPPEALAAAARRKSDRALDRARTALRELAVGDQPVSFQAVARSAGVSRQWLYTQPELRAEIERLRARRREHAPDRGRAAERASEASLRQRVESLLEENRRLRHEIASLNHELALAYGRQRATSGSGRSCVSHPDAALPR